MNFKVNAGLVEQPKRDIYLAINSVKQDNLSSGDIEASNYIATLFLQSIFSLL